MTKSSTDAIVVMTFNVLARNQLFIIIEKLIKREFYPHCSKQDLKLKFRAPKVMQEILRHDPDIVINHC